MRVKRAIAVVLPLAMTACNMDSSPALQEPTTGVADTGTQLVPAQQAIQQADIGGMDLGTMNAAEVRKVISPGPHCVFTYVEDGRPVLVAVPGRVGPARSYVKVHGKLVELKSTSAAGLAGLATGARFRTDGMAVAVAPLSGASAASDRRVEADLVFAVQRGLQVGYGGFYSCRKAGLPQVNRFRR